MSNFTFVTEVEKPWVLATQRAVNRQDFPDGVLILELDAASMRNLEGLYREFASVLKFPTYFGKNFNALDECITDLDWLPAEGYVLLIRNAEYLLEEESSSTLRGLLSILHSAGEKWATPIESGEAWDRKGIPFHTILRLDGAKEFDFKSKLKKLDFEVQNV